VLGGLSVNSLFGWSWADPFAGLVIAAVAAKEGLEAWTPALHHHPRYPDPYSGRLID
jgi:hypothetical protein